VYPDAAALAGLSAFDEPLPETGSAAIESLHLLDSKGSPATTASNGPSYFGFVIGAALPAASAVERLMLAWDQCGSSFANSPVADTVERVAARWLLDVLRLPAESAVGFGTSATACSLTCLVAARRALLTRKGWDLDGDGLIGAPEIRVVISQTAHITIKKALRVLGFGTNRIIIAPTDAYGRVDPAQLPPLTDLTILCLQAGEVNTGEFDPFVPLITAAQAANARVHVDGAFGIWARASARAPLTEGIEAANSWTTDGHKWLNTPYDNAMAICRDAGALSAAMNSDAVYLSSAHDAQKNLTLEFSRRPRGISVWAALRSLGRAGVAEMVDRHCTQAKYVAEQLEAAGYQLLNRVVINQVLICANSDAQTLAIQHAAQQSGKTWLGTTSWNGRLALRISISSWRTEETHIRALVETLITLLRASTTWCGCGCGAGARAGPGAPPEAFNAPQACVY